MRFAQGGSVWLARVRMILIVKSSSMYAEYWTALLVAVFVSVT
jgi:hypothetical protein